MNRNLQNRVYTILHGRTPRDPSTDDENKDENKTEAETEEKQNIYGIENPQLYMDSLTKNISNNYSLKELTTNIFGIPYQFLPSTDFRFDSENPVFGFGFFRPF